MKKQKLPVLFPLFLLLLFSTFHLSAQESEAHPIPQWLLDNWAEQVAGTGIWTTDNSEYKGEQEPYDAYGMKWEWGLGQKHIKGKLYCIIDGEDVGTVWEFLSFWDPAKEEVHMFQIGSDGTLGEGHMWQLKDGSTKSEETFTSPTAGAFSAGHHTWMEDGKMHTQSFNIENGEWTKRRYYVWDAEPEKELATPEVYQDLAFLIGEWKSGNGKGQYAKMRFEWADNKRMIKFQGTNRRFLNKPEELETDGVITYHGTKDQLVFINTYMREETHLISEGTYEIDKNGAIHRPFTCHYKAGDKLPWSDGAVAPEGGKSIEFKQIWTPIDEDSFNGEFYWKKDGQWKNPLKKSGDDYKEVWKRVK